MNTAVIFFVVFGVALVKGQWAQGGMQMQGGGMGSWQGEQMGQRMGGGRSGGMSGRMSSGMGGGMADGRYGARLIDTPTQVGYEATIPGATSRFVHFRSEGGRGGRAEGGARGQSGVDQRGESGQGNQWENSGSRW